MILVKSIFYLLKGTISEDLGVSDFWSTQGLEHGKSYESIFCW